MVKITITQYTSMPGRWRVECDPGPGKRKFGRDSQNAGEAAAVAINYSFGAPEYLIIGHDDAMKNIPLGIRMRRL